MSKNMNEIKAKQLGMPIGTATAILRKSILFSLVKQLKLDICFQCNQKIENVNNFSIEHKIPWLHSQNPIELFFSLDNISFSHLHCNIKAARQTRTLKHGTESMYTQKRCKCDICKQSMRNIWKLKRREQREKKRNGLVLELADKVDSKSTVEIHGSSTLP